MKKPKTIVPLELPPLIVEEPPPTAMTKAERQRFVEMEAGKAKLAAKMKSAKAELTSAGGMPPEDDEPPLPLDLPPVPKMKTIVADTELTEADLNSALDKLKKV